MAFLKLLQTSLTILIVAIPVRSGAANFQLIDEPSRIGISIIGKIEHGDYQRFVQFITPTESGSAEQIRRVRALLWGTLYLDSAGGDVAEALKIAERVAEAFVHTSVQRDGTCFSSCFLIWAAGVARRLEEGGRLGVHRLAWTGRGVDVTTYEKRVGPATVAVDSFLTRQGIPRRLLDRMAETAPSDIYILTEQSLLANDLFDAISYRPSYRDVVEKDCGPHPAGGNTRRARRPDEGVLLKWLECESRVQEANQLREYARLGSALEYSSKDNQKKTGQGAQSKSTPSDERATARPGPVQRRSGSADKGPANPGASESETRPLSRSGSALPETGILKYPFRYAMAPLTIRTAAGSNFLVRLIDTSSDQVVTTAFVRGGDVLHMKVPLGSYRIRYASGTAWFGEDAEDPFGPDTAYSEADRTFEFRDDGASVSGFTVELIKQRHGNLQSKKISKKSFNGR